MSVYCLVTPILFSVTCEAVSPQRSIIDRERKQQHITLSHFPTKTDLIYMPSPKHCSLGQNSGHEDCKQSQPRQRHM
ncbi:hypothetical protein F5148DRAFT_580792 [Russula earlei]|uniref:Uncharacterized protein n=1 Tax=Russula earlei TaxID=71964 RepID=A0ACC0UGK2_9AGAM|nr:hypothetical protein F5148DRAFT_580792 [Russula earlei]